MRYHYEKPQIYLSMYGVRYVCEHPVYNSCTLFLIGDKGIAVIQQRFDARTKTTWWSEVDSWLTDDLYLHPNFKGWSLHGWPLSDCDRAAAYVGTKNEAAAQSSMGDLFRQERYLNTRVLHLVL